METLITVPNVTFILGLLAIMFSIYSYFRNPQINSEKIDALLTQKLNDIESQVRLFQNSLQTHIQSDVVSFGNLNQHIVEVDKSVVKLTTIIEERIPRHKK